MVLEQIPNKIMQIFILTNKRNLDYNFKNEYDYFKLSVHYLKNIFIIVVVNTVQLIIILKIMIYQIVNLNQELYVFFAKI